MQWIKTTCENRFSLVVKGTLGQTVVPSHKRRVALLLVELVADVVDIGGEVVLGMVVDDVTDIRDDQILEYALFQVFQEPAESDRFHFKL